VHLVKYYSNKGINIIFKCLSDYNGQNAIVKWYFKASCSNWIASHRHGQLPPNAHVDEKMNLVIIKATMINCGKYRCTVQSRHGSGSGYAILHPTYRLVYKCHWL